MIKFLFLIFLFFILMVSLLGFSVMRTIGRVLFGRGSGGHNKTQYRRQQQQQQQTTHRQRSASNKKIFDKDEGEYVDYEEIKD